MACFGYVDLICFGSSSSWLPSCRLETYVGMREKAGRGVRAGSLGGKKLLVRFFGARYHYLAGGEGGGFSCWTLLLIEGVATGKGRGEGVACLCTI